MIFLQVLHRDLHLALDLENGTSGVAPALFRVVTANFASIILGITLILPVTSDFCNRKFWVVTIHLERAQNKQCGVKADALYRVVLTGVEPL
jgi:hypothetical protein